MIPKLIHYCWFGKGDIPKHLQKCIDSWSEILPEYKIIRWDETNFDVNSNLWTKQAYDAKKYAFVSDYVRLCALKQYGGVYLDTDVFVKKNLDSLLFYDAFTGFENEKYLTSAVIGAVPRFPLILEFLSTYEGQSFRLPDGSQNQTPNVVIMTEICKKYGLAVNDTEQDIAGLHVFPREVFCPIDFYHNKNITDQTLTIHYFDASWLDTDTKKIVRRERTFTHKLFIKIKLTVAKIIQRR